MFPITDDDFASTEPRNDAGREARARRLGRLADAAFGYRCMRLGIGWRDAIKSPLATLALAAARAEGTA